MAFTTWAAEKTKVLNQISDLNDALLNSEMSHADRSFRRQNLKDLREHLDFVTKKAAEEANSNGYRPLVGKFRTPG
jgi:hypothetical protein